MRLHRNLVLAIIKVLDGVFNQDLYADKTIEKILKQDKRWGSRDRGFIAETSYDQPYFKTKVGVYRTKLEAKKALLTIKKQFKSAFIYVEKVTLDKL